MRDVRYKILPPVGPGEGPWEYACLNEFIFHIPTFSYSVGISGVIPPIHVLNEIFKQGEDDAGMSGGAKWKPFEIENDEYNELVEMLLTSPEKEFIEDRELWEKKNLRKWTGALFSKYSKKIRGET
ncbi:MAG: hypothetical protein AB2591_19805 [Candidatus Thiodiazotropha sp.]